MNNNYNHILKALLPFCYTLTLSYILSIAVFMYLPKKGISSASNNSFKIDVHKYNLAHAFSLKQIKNTFMKQDDYQFLSTLEINAIYLDKSHKSWVVLINKKNSETIILSKFDRYKEFNLLHIYKDHIVFEKQRVRFKLKIEEKK